MLRIRSNSSRFIDGVAMNKETAKKEPKEIKGFAQRNVSSVINVVKFVRKNFQKFLNLELSVTWNCWGKGKA